MLFTTQGLALLSSDVVAGVRRLGAPGRLDKWVGYLTTQLSWRIANRREAKYAPPSCCGTEVAAWLAQAAY